MDQDYNRLQSIYHGSSKWVQQTRSSSMVETPTSFELKHEFGSSEISKGEWRGRTGNVVRLEEMRQRNFEEDAFYAAIVTFGDNEEDKGRSEGTKRRNFESTVAQLHGPFDRTRAFGIPTIYKSGTPPDMYKPSQSDCTVAQLHGPYDRRFTRAFGSPTIYNKIYQSGTPPDMYKRNKLLEKEFADLREFSSQSDLETNRHKYFEEEEQVVFHTIGTEKRRSLPQEYLKLSERKIRKLEEEEEVDQIKFQPFGSIKPLKFKLNLGGTFPKEFHEQLWEYLTFADEAIKYFQSWKWTDSTGARSSGGKNHNTELSPISSELLDSMDKILLLLMGLLAFVLFGISQSGVGYLALCFIISNSTIKIKRQEPDAAAELNEIKSTMSSLDKKWRAHSAEIGSLRAQVEILQKKPMQNIFTQRSKQVNFIVNGVKIEGLSDKMTTSSRAQSVLEALHGVCDQLCLNKLRNEIFGIDKEYENLPVLTRRNTSTTDNLSECVK